MRLLRRREGDPLTKEKGDIDGGTRVTVLVSVACVYLRLGLSTHPLLFPLHSLETSTLAAPRRYSQAVRGKMF